MIGRDFGAHKSSDFIFFGFFFSAKHIIYSILTLEEFFYGKSCFTGSPLFSHQQHAQTTKIDNHAALNRHMGSCSSSLLPLGCRMCVREKERETLSHTSMGFLIVTICPDSTLNTLINCIHLGETHNQRSLKLVFIEKIPVNVFNFFFPRKNGVEHFVYTICIFPDRILFFSSSCTSFYF